MNTTLVGYAPCSTDKQDLTAQRQALAELGVASASTSVEDMNLPGLRLHPLRGNYQGFWSVTVQANWRVIFRFDAGDAVDADYPDYHER